MFIITPLIHVILDELPRGDQRKKPRNVIKNGQLQVIDPSNVEPAIQRLFGSDKLDHLHYQFDKSFRTNLSTPPDRRTSPRRHDQQPKMLQRNTSRGRKQSHSRSQSRARSIPTSKPRNGPVSLERTQSPPHRPLDEFTSYPRNG